MVLPLTDFCLLSLGDAIENGHCPPIHILTPLLRQAVLDTVLLRRAISKQSSLSSLASLEFLRGMTSLSTLHGSVYDGPYLDRVADSLAHDAANGNPVVISELRLNIYYAIDGREYGPKLCDVNSHHAVRLIGKCPNLVSLGLERILLHTYEPRDCSLSHLAKSHLSAVRLKFGCVMACEDSRCLLYKLRLSCPEILDRVHDLSISELNYAETCTLLFKPANPVISFRHLASLRLVSVTVLEDEWKAFLLSIKETLTYLDLDKLQQGIEESYWYTTLTDEWIVPFSLPRLASLIVTNYDVRCSDALVDNLVQCPKLESVRLEIGCRGLMCDSLPRLRRVGDKLQIRFNLDRDFPERCLQIMDTFKRHITGISLPRPFLNHGRIIPILQLVGSRCEQLQSFCMHGYYVAAQHHSAWLEMTALLCPLFRDSVRAAHLDELSLHGHYDHDTLSSIFENCINVNNFSIVSCPQLVDEHLRRWAERGVRLSALRIIHCDSITDSGVIPLYKNSPDLILVIHAMCSKITDRAWRVLFHYCRRVRSLRAFPPVQMTDICAKPFYPLRPYKPNEYMEYVCAEISRHPFDSSCYFHHGLMHFQLSTSNASTMRDAFRSLKEVTCSTAMS